MLASTIIAGALVVAGSAQAQAASGTAAPNASAASVAQTAPTNSAPAGLPRENQVTEVVVTGSRIARPNLEQPTPVSTVTPQQIQNAGTVNLGDIIAQLPAVSAVGTTRSNSNSFGNSAGLSQINLRDLGVSRTLVLVDGQRHVAGDITTNAVDVNSIPATLVDRVEVITGGASAIYGSDAVTGVVNIILKKNFEGIDAQAQYGEYEGGFGASYSGSITVGHNFLDGRLNITATGFYDNEDGFFVSQIPHAANYGTIVNPADIKAGSFDPTYFSSGAPITKDGIPDRLLVPNVGSDLVARNGVLLDANTFGPLVAFDRNGNPIKQSARTGYNSFAFAQLPANCVDCYFQDAVTQDRSPLQTYGGDFRINYDFNPHLHGFFDAKVVEAQATNAIQGSFTFGDNQLQPDNAYITPALRALLPTSAAAYPYYSAFVTDTRDYIVTRDTYRVVGGFSGDFDLPFANVKWDGALNYGRTDTRFQNSGLRITNNFLASFDSVIDPKTGQAACRINVPSAIGPGGLPYAGESAAANPQACTPFNPFGVHNDQPAYQYAFGTFNTYDSLTQEVANINATADSSKFFNLQGGPLALAFGGEYRMERTKEVNDTALTNGSTENLAADSSGGFNVYEGYIEASAPIFRHFRPGIDELSFDAAYRGSQYSTVGHTDAYKFSGVYGPLSWIKLRTTYSRAVRAPNITEAFLPTQGTFFNITDPCDASNITGNVNYAANCKAAGVPNPFTANTNASITGQTGGNPNLDPEKSISYTGGFVIQPPWVQGLSITADYYAIKIKNAITQVSAQDIINNCYNGPSLATAYCSLFTRGANNNINFIKTTFVNSSKLETDGVDLQVSYVHSVAPLTSRFAMTRFLDGRFNLDLSANYVFHLRNFPFQNQPDQVNILEGTVNNPRLKALSIATYTQGPLQLSWETQFIGRVARFNRNATTVDKSEATNIPFAEANFYHNIVARYDLPFHFTKGVQIYGGVNNLFGETIPIGLTDGAGGDASYQIGRYFFGGIRIRR